MSAYNRPEPTDRRAAPREDSGRRKSDLSAFHDRYCQAPECRAYREAIAEIEATHIVHERTTRGECEWFFGCTYLATHLVEHSLLGDVPTCDRCLRWIDSLTTEPIERKPICEPV